MNFVPCFIMALLAVIVASAAERTQRDWKDGAIGLWVFAGALALFAFIAALRTLPS